MLIYLNLTRPLAIKKYDVSFEISDNKIGFDLNATSLKFGRTFAGSEVSKELNVVNSYDFPIKAEIAVSDNLEGLVFVREEIIIEPYQTKSFSVFLGVPSNYSVGNYTGEMIISFVKFRE